MLSARENLLQELDEQKTVSLHEKQRRVESDRREKILKEQRNDFLRSKGITPVDPDAEEQDEEALEREREAISSIQLNEAVRILADYIQLETAGRPRAAMRN
jgi:carboxyl-terminal processing protease